MYILTPGVTVLEIAQDDLKEEETGNEVGGRPEDVSADLRLLNERADILCKELKQLNIENKPVTSNDEDIGS